MENPKRHKHADLIHAWAEGAEIEGFNPNTGEWVHTNAPNFNRNYEYRIKPKEPEWWDNIPEHGVLCRHENDANAISLIRSSILASFWIPLTNEEIERFKR